MATACPVTSRLPVSQRQNYGAFRLGYRPWLDGLRGVAILLVLLFHLGLLPGGFLGVDVFFVLSGFLITSLLHEEWERSGTISFRRFYLRRALRLLPVYFTVLLVCFAYTLLFRPAAEVLAFRREMLVAACYASNLPGLHRPGLLTLGHTWSLALEEQFYLLWPALLYILLRANLGRRATFLIVAAGLLASAGLRAGLFLAYRVPGPDVIPLIYRLYSCLDTRADALLAGCLAALLAGWGLLPQSSFARKLAGLAALASAGLLTATIVVVKHFGHPQFYLGYFTGIALMVAAILIGLLTYRPRLVSIVLESRALVFIGRLSYGLYLVQVPIIVWVRPEEGLGWKQPRLTALAAGLSVLAAVVLHFTIERPFLRLKDRLRWPMPAGTIPTHSSSPVPQTGAAWRTPGTGPGAGPAPARQIGPLVGSDAVWTAHCPIPPGAAQ